ncbi:hypothetical protein D3C80_2211550 [compost metagenome]
MPWLTKNSAINREIGSSTYSVTRKISSQALPMVALERRVKARISAKATAMPVAADKKFCTASPAIWLR